MSEKKGLYYNVNKRKKEGKPPKKKGDEGYPSDKAWDDSKKTAKEGENDQIKGGDPCWSGYKMVGKKNKGGKRVPNCVPEDIVRIESPFSDELIEGEVLEVANGRAEVLTGFGIRHVPVMKLLDEGTEWVNEDGEVIDLDEYVVFDDETGEILSEKKKDFNLKAKHKSDKGGLTDAGRKAHNRATGSKLKRPQPEGGKRKTSYCARSKGQQDDHNIDCRKDPDKRICKARRRWKC